MRFKWQTAGGELTALRSHITKHFLHPTEPGKRICIQSSGLLHAYTDKGFQDIERELRSYKFPEGLELTGKADRHPIMNLPSWGKVELKDNVVRVYDKKGVPIFKYTTPAVCEKGKEAFITSLDADGIEVKTPSPDLESVEFEVEGNKLYLKMPSTLKSKYPLQVFDDTETGSTNNKDTMLASAQVTYNYGVSVNLTAGQGAGGVPNRPIIHFTLSSDPGGTPTAVSLFMYVNAISGTPTVNAHELTETGWAEGSGDGSATGDGATWNTYNGTDNWTSAGGDYDGDVIDSTAVPAATNSQEWVLMGTGSDNPLTLTWESEVHILLKHSTESGANSYGRYNSKEAGSNEPYIQITYTAVLTILPSAISSAEALGTPVVAGPIIASAIDSAEAFGTTNVKQVLYPSAIASLEGFGTPKLNLIIFPNTISSAEDFGTTKLILYLLPSSIASLEALGSPMVKHIIQPSGVASIETFGTPYMNVKQTIILLDRPDPEDQAIAGEGDDVEGVYYLGASPGGDYTNLNSLDDMAKHLKIGGANTYFYHDYDMVDFSDPSTAINSVMLTFRLYREHTSCASWPYVEIGGVKYFGDPITPTNNVTWETKTYTWTYNPALGVGNPFTTAVINAAKWGIRESGYYTVIPSPTSYYTRVSYMKRTVAFVRPGEHGVDSAEAFGTPKLVLYILPGSIASAEAFGTAFFNVKQLISLAGAIASSEAFGTPQLNLWINVSGIASSESFGTPVLAGPIIVDSGIASEEAFGTPQLNLYVGPSGIATGEAFGSLTVMVRVLYTVPLTYMVEVRDTDGNLVAILENAYGVGYMQRLNAPHKLSFMLPSDDTKKAHVTAANEVWLREYVSQVVTRKFKLQYQADERS